MAPRKKTQPENPTQELVELNKISVPVYPLRVYLADLTNAGILEVPLGALIVEIKRIYNENKEL